MANAIPELPASRVGPYRIERRLGAGGMGVVYLGVDDFTGVAAAVKLLRPEYVADPQLRDRLRREVAAARRVPRFCTAQLLGAELDADPPWVATEYIEAPSLDVVLLEHGQLPEVDIEAFAVGVAVALRAIHRHGVVHRDLKPSNILLSQMGPRVIDFGIALVEGADARLGQLTPTGAVVGTPRYMAPEQLRGGPVTAAVDIFAWAGLVTYAATGHLPFGTADEVAAAILADEPDLGDLTPPLRTLVARALHKDPAARPSAAALVDYLSYHASAVTTQVLATAGAAPTGRAPGAPGVPGALDAPGAPDAPDAPDTTAAPGTRWTRRRTLATMVAAAGAVATTSTALRWLSHQDEDGYQLGEPLLGHGSAVDSVAVGELAGEPIAVSAGGFDQTVRVWHLGTGTQIEELATGPDSDIRSVAVGQRDGRPVAVLGGKGAPSMQVWDLTSGEQMDVLFTDHTNELYHARVSSVAVDEWDGAAIVVSGGFDRTVRVWDLMTGDQLGDPYAAYTEREALTAELTVAAGELDGSPAAVAGGSFQPPWAQVWDLSSGEQIGALRTGHASRISSVAVGEVDGTPVIVSGSQDHTVRAWEPATGRQVGPELTGHSRYVRSVAFTEVDGVPIAVSGGNDRTVRVWDLSSGEQIGPALTGHTGNVTCVAVGELAGAPIAVSAGGHHDSTVRRWRLPSPALTAAPDR